MAGLPQFGGTGGVEELDIGQKGSPRNAGNSAKWSGNVLEGGDQPSDVRHGLAQQNIVFRDVLGFAGKTVRWVGNLKVVDDLTLGAIASDLNQRLHSSVTSGGIVGPPDPSRVRETRLTNSFGRVISERAVLAGWRFTDRVRTVSGQSPLTLIVPLEIEFFVLG